MVRRRQIVLSHLDSDLPKKKTNWSESPKLRRSSELVSFKGLVYKSLVSTGANPMRSATWKPGLDSTAKRLSWWKGRHMLIGRRVVLINRSLVLAAFHCYIFISLKLLGRS